jgi:hypothetical protein
VSVSERTKSCIEQGEQWPNGEMLPEICLRVRAALNGSSDPWGEDDYEKCLAMLKRRRHTWAAPNHSSRVRGMHEARIDDAVWEMVLATIALLELREKT